MSTETALSVQSPRSPIAVGNSGLQLATLDDMFRFASAVSKSGMAPRGIDTPEAIFVAMQMGAEVGLTPMAALQNIAIINGRPGIYGDAALALVRASGLLESYAQRMEGEGEGRRAVVVSKRKGGESITTEFGISDAKKAGLWGKGGPWSQYPERMLLWRARGFNLRDNFGDVLKGLKTTEELADYNADGEPINVTPQQEAPALTAAPVERPKPPARRGSARAAAEAQPVKEAQPEPSPAPAEAAPQSSSSAPAQAEPVREVTQPAAASTPPPVAEAKKDDAPPAAPKPPAIQDGIDIEGFFGAAWPLDLVLEIKEVKQLALTPQKTPVAVFTAHVEGQVPEQILQFVTIEGVGLDASGKPKLIGDTLTAGKKIAANVYARLRAGRTDVAPVLWAAKLAQSEEF